MLVFHNGFNFHETALSVLSVTGNQATITISYYNDH